MHARSEARQHVGDGRTADTKLVIDAEGKVTIHRQILKRRGLHPGNGLTFIEANAGLLVYHHGTDSLTVSSQAGLDEDERQQSHAERSAMRN